MANPILDTLRKYDMIPLTWVIVSLPKQGGPIVITTQRRGGMISRPSSPDPNITIESWDAYEPIIDQCDGEYYRHEVARFVRSAAEISNALGVQTVRDGAETRWHFRPCNSRHWIIKTIGKRSVRLPR
jgi:hypothetical protein